MRKFNSYLKILTCMAAVFCDSIPIIFLLLHKPVVQFVHRFNSQVMVDVGCELVFR